MARAIFIHHQSTQGFNAFLIANDKLALPKTSSVPGLMH